MSKMQTFLSMLKTPGRMVLPLAEMGVFNWMPDKQYLQLVYHANTGKRLNLNHPQTFNEKMQWLKLNDRKALYTTMVDKYAVKEYVASIIGDEYIIPTLGVWDNSEGIDLSELPEQFVLKCTHDNGSVIICSDRKTFDFETAKKKLRVCLKKNAYWSGREWPYKNVVPRIIAEPYLKDDETNDLRDYKIHCFNGEPKVILVCRNRFSDAGSTVDFFDTDWNHFNVRRVNHGNSKDEIPCPPELPQMLKMAKKLSEGLLFLRVDFYIVNHQILFGELTFYPNAGLEVFVPSDFDEMLGDWVEI